VESHFSHNPLKSTKKPSEVPLLKYCQRKAKKNTTNLATKVIITIEKNTFKSLFFEILSLFFLKEISFTLIGDIIYRNFFLTIVNIFKLVNPISLNSFIKINTPIRIKDIVIVCIHNSVKKVPNFILTLP
jgi:CxxC motif-containing protein